MNNTNIYILNNDSNANIIAIIANNMNASEFRAHA